MSRSRRLAGSRIGPWTLTKLLGEGGNAEVWLANTHDQEVALKIPWNMRAGSEPYARLCREVAIVRQLSHLSGVLPVVDASLPARPSKAEIPWVALQPAIPLREAIPDDLRQVIIIVRDIARTLISCHDNGVFHRDVKPANLYLVDGEARISDFGIAHFPTRDALTKQGARLGPTFFLPDELLNDAASADHGAVDVFELAKTLWVLATGQNYPPQGEVQLQYSGSRIASFRNEPATHQIDLLVNRCTKTDPTSRPTMQEMADELTACATPRQTKLTGVSNVDSEIARLARISEQINRNDERNDGIREAARSLQSKIGDRLQPVVKTIAARTGMHVEVTHNNHINTVVTHDTLKYAKDAHGLSVQVELRANAKKHNTFLASGIGLYVASDVDTLSLVAAHVIRKSTNGDILVWQHKAEVIPNSALANQSIDNMLNAIDSNLGNALACFADALNSPIER